MANTLKMRVDVDGDMDNLRYNFMLGKLKELKSSGLKTALEVGPDDGTMVRGVIGCGFDVESLGLKPKETSFTWHHYQMDIQLFPLPIKYDVILAGQVLEHIENVDVAMKYILAMG